MKGLRSIAGLWLCLACLCVAPLSHAQSSLFGTPGSRWSAASFFSRKAEPAGIVTYKISTFNSVLGNPKWSIDLYGFGGATVGAQSPLAGLLIGKTFPLAANVSALTGIGYSTEGKTAHAGIALGLSIQF